MSVLHFVLFLHTITQIYIRFTRFFSLSLLQSNLTRKIKANILASATIRKFRTTPTWKSARAHARAQLTLIVFYKSRHRRHRRAHAVTQMAVVGLAKNYNHN